MFLQDLSYADTMAGELADRFPPASFNQALTETLSDYADFVQADQKGWFHVEGGMSVVTNTMAARLKSTIWPQAGAISIDVSLSTPAVAMSLISDGRTIQVTTGGEKSSTNSYDMVFNTTALGPLQQVDLSGLNLDRDILDGIHASITTGLPKWPSTSTSAGGRVSTPMPTPCTAVAVSDLPLGFTVYPSWDNSDGTNVLIASCTWAQDASRMATLVPDYTDPSTPTPSYTGPITAVCLEGLVKLLAGPQEASTLKGLHGYYITHHAWAWSHDPCTCGAFALFGPGRFQNIYPKFQELLAISAHHAWISGALDSVLFSVTKFLAARSTESPDVATKALKLLVSDSNPDKKHFEKNERGEHPEGDERLAYWCAEASAMK
ncbi:LOW QUALITY PROTEIN: hypothetical protein QC761_0092530 [Podospora bellae-mahoneyi]|uniref:Amine oxidase domain-containing protein n=1 Tax=Podospora bellae-mahoneyi TaxID=2093777 RepID=A0ABR0FA01_9PEZI|nr:LOW QUALITY PROTEIN: hypothetical protein QC761_0092530 [Podospora bellae-mahoneyi]